MHTNIYNFQYDFEQQNGHFMVIQGQESNQLTSDDLANVQVNMLKSNAIDKMLPVEIEEIDFKVRLYYNTTGKRILSHVLREDTLAINELYELLYHIVSAVESSKEYMLNDQHYIIQDDFIFIGNNFKDIYLTYLPLNQVDNKPSLKEELRELLFKLVGQVKELAGDGVQQLMNALNEDNFNIADLKKTLNQLRKQANVSSTPRQPVQAAPVVPKREQAPINNHQQQEAPLQQQARPKPNQVPRPKQVPKPNKQRNNAKKAPQQVKGNKGNNLNNKTNASPDAESSKETKPNIIIIAICGLVPIIAVWKLLEMKPSDLMLYIAIGVSVLSVVGAIAAYVFIKNKGANGEKIVSQMKKSPKKKKAKKGVTQQPPQKTHSDVQAVSQVHKNISPQSADTNLNQHAPNPAVQQAAATLNEEAYFKNLQNQTTLLSDEPGTVLLNEEIPPAGTAFLEVQRDHGPERIPLKQSKFTVGRNPSGIEYVEDSVGISRLHFEIQRTQDKYNIKDLGSKNGSKLNNEPMIAYKVYTLTDGDVITAGKIEYMFKEG